MLAGKGENGEHHDGWRYHSGDCQIEKNESGMPAVAGQFNAVRSVTHQHSRYFPSTQFFGLTEER